MKKEYTEDGYLKVSADGKETLNYNEIQQMNTTPYILPSFRDRYEKNSILFHKGDYVSFSEYLKTHEIDFLQMQKMILKLTDIYMGMEQNGFQTGNVLPYLDCIFIREKSADIKIIYIPMTTVMEEEGFHALLKNICYGVRTKDSAILLGTLLEEANKIECNLGGFKKEIQAVGNTSEVKEIEKVVEKIVEKTVEIPVEREKIIEKEVKVTDSKALCMTAVIAELVTGIIAPIFLHVLFDDRIAVMPQISSYLLSGIMITVVVITNYLVGKNTTETAVDSSTADETKNNSPQSVEDEVFKARIVRDNKKDYQKANVNNIQWDGEEEGTAVLFGSDPLNEAYIIEEGKAGLMDRIFIDCDNFIIGRESGVNYKIEEGSVSKRHAEIKRIGGEYFIKDLNSSNGTFVGNKKIKENTDTQLSDGIQLKFGSKKYTFYRK